MYNLRILKFLENIPGTWKRAYLWLCFWYAINYVVGTFIEWKLTTPHSYVFWNALYLFEALCILIIAIFFYSNWLFKFSIYVQVTGHLAGAMLHFMIMGTFSYYL